MSAMDALFQSVIKMKNPSVLGLDTRYEYVPEEIRYRAQGSGALARAAHAVFLYNRALIDALCDIVPAVKVQAAYYEMLGYHGIKAFYDSMLYAKQNGMMVIADVKRNDIGSTAEAYASAYLGKTGLPGLRESEAFPSDMVTVNPYLGSDGVLPFVNAAKAYDKAVFVLVKTSNASSGEFQDITAEGKPLYMHVADRVVEWGKDSIGEMGYSAVGAVVGATYARQGEELRARMPHVCFLLPGYGAQGGKAEDLPGMFDKNGLGAVVNASRSLICAYMKEEYQDLNYDDAARREALRMRDDIVLALASAGKAL